MSCHSGPAHPAAVHELGDALTGVKTSPAIKQLSYVHGLMQLQETEVVWRAGRCWLPPTTVPASRKPLCLPQHPSPAGLHAAAPRTPHAAAAAVLLIAAAQPQCAPSYHHQAPDAAAQPANKHTNSTGQHGIIAGPAVRPYPEYTCAADVTTHMVPDVIS